MTLSFNGVDLSGMVTKYGYSETPRVISGPNETTARDGSIIDDTRAVKFDPTFTLWPLQPTDVTKIWQLAALKGMHTLVYVDATGTTRTVQARMRLNSGAQLALVSSERTFYNGIVVRFEVK